MSSPITQCPHAEIKPTPPLSIYKIFIVIVAKCLHLPQLPIERLRYLLRRRKTLDVWIPPMPAPRHVHVCIYPCNVLDNSGIFPSLKLEVIRFRMSLISHLRNDLSLFTSFPHHQLHFPKGLRHRLFYIYMLATL